MAVERSRRATANAAFKAGYRKTMDVALAISLAAHLLAFALVPNVDIPRARPEPEELELIEIEAPPEIEIPAPPEEIARPAVPIEEPSADVEAATIEEAKFAPDPLPDAPAPPPPPPPSPPAGDGEWLTFDRPPKPRRMPFSDADYPAAARAAEI
ncbi:MAG: hypothetical protein ACRDGR_05185, partial [bacterium]